MSNFFSSQPQQYQQGAEAMQQGDFITRDEFYSYLRSDSFRSVMKNQNSDLYKFGEWQSWNPVLRLASDNLPYLSADATQTGGYTRIGNTVVCSFGFKFGAGNPASSGTGSMYVELPFNAARPSLPSSVAGTAPNNYVYTQSFQGTFYMQQWVSSSIPGSLAWGAAGIASDATTGQVTTPSRVEFWLGNLGYLGGSGGAYDPFNGEPIIDQLTFTGMRKVTTGWPWSGGTPLSSSVISGQVIYEAVPDVN